MNYIFYEVILVSESILLATGAGNGDTMVKVLLPLMEKISRPTIQSRVHTHNRAKYRVS